MNKKISTPLAISIIFIVAVVVGVLIIYLSKTTEKPLINPEIQTNNKKNEIKSVESFIPNGWKIIQEIEDDLNKDSLKDTVVVIENVDQKLEDGSLCEKNNECPRSILVLFQKSGENYELSIRSDKAILLANEGGVFGDPYDAIKVDNGSLLINFYGGSNWRWSNSYRFRYQNNDWFLIGATLYEYFNVYSCVDKKTDINFLTGKKQEITSNKWNNYYNQNDNEPCIRNEEWFNIKDNKLIKLSDFKANSFNLNIFNWEKI